MPAPKVVKRTTTTVEEYLDVETEADEAEHDDAADEDREDEESEQEDEEEASGPRRKRR